MPDTYEPMPYGKRRAYKKRSTYAPKKKTRVFKKPRTYRRKTYTKAKSLRPKWVNPMDEKQLIKFVYQDTGFGLSLESTNSWTADYVFRGNSPYDPDLSGVGVQPYGFDQYMGSRLASAFRVSAASIKVYFHLDPDYSSTRKLQCHLIPWRQDHITTTDVSDIRAIPMHRETAYDPVTETSKGSTIKHYVTNRMIFKDYSSNDYLLDGSYAGNPSLGWFWIIRFIADDQFEDDSLYVLFDVKIKYYTVIHNRGEPDES